jgi:lipoate-protein ligase A
VDWRFTDSGALDGSEQMAIDAGLMERARETGESVLRVYSWNRPTLSFGRHESVRGRFSAAVLGAAGVSAVRRPTGGRALLHDHEVTYSVTAPAADAEPLAESYRNINAMLLRALAALGVHASESPHGPPLRPGDPAGLSCFAAPAAGELVVGDRKLVGSAQLRERGAMLQHGSILVDDDQPRIATLASGPVTAPLPAASLRACLGRAPAYEEVRDALFAALVGSVQRVTVLDASDASRHAEPHRARFASAEWTWRR